MLVFAGRDINGIAMGHDSQRPDSIEYAVAQCSGIARRVDCDPCLDLHKVEVRPRQDDNLEVPGSHVLLPPTGRGAVSLPAFADIRGHLRKCLSFAGLELCERDTKCRHVLRLLRE